MLLRERGHDVIAAEARADTRGLSDPELLALRLRDHRALMTEDVGDFMPLVQRLAADGDRHRGLVLTSPGTIGLFVESLDRFLRDRTAQDALRDRIHWLGPQQPADG